MAVEEKKEYVSTGQLTLLEKILRGELASLRQENDFLKILMAGVIIVLFVGYAALLVGVFTILFSIFRK